MVLKLVRTKKYDEVEGEEVIYKGNIKDINCFYPLNNNGKPAIPSV